MKMDDIEQFHIGDYIAISRLEAIGKISSIEEDGTLLVDVNGITESVIPQGNEPNIIIDKEILLACGFKQGYNGDFFLNGCLSLCTSSNLSKYEFYSDVSGVSSIIVLSELQKVIRKDFNIELEPDLPKLLECVKKQRNW